MTDTSLGYLTGCRSLAADTVVYIYADTTGRVLIVGREWTVADSELAIETFGAMKAMNGRLYGDSMVTCDHANVMGWSVMDVRWLQHGGHRAAIALIPRTGLAPASVLRQVVALGSPNCAELYNPPAER